jgi:uncharacterized coiled-coil protein SlyX
MSELLRKIANMDNTIHLLQNQLRQQEMNHDRKMKKMEKKLKRIQSTVYQLVGGLFHHKKQSEILDTHTSYLFGEKSNDDLMDDPAYYGSYPTTRQGDALEKRIAALERRV